MGATTQIFSANARLLRRKASRYAWVGTIIGVIAVLVATALRAYFDYGAFSLMGLIEAQKASPSLWLIDVMPFAFAFWGQYASSMMAYEAGALVVDQTSELRAQAEALENEAQRASTHDTLTDLPNRALLFDRVEQALSAARKSGSLVAVAVVGLDRFKEVNDALGRYAGDRILKQVATRIQGVLSKPQTLARPGGDEFALLLPSVTSSYEVGETLRKVEKALHPPFMIEEVKVDVEASIGVAYFPDHGQDADTLLKRADVAMSFAKERSGEFVVYSPRLDEHSSHRLTLMAELRNAIKQEELVLHFQPKVRADTGALREMEALIRWPHPTHGLIQPDAFIPMAERTGLMKPLTKWALNASLAHCAAWRAAGFELAVAVNLSPSGLLNIDLPDTLAGLLASHELPGEALVIEITESSIMTDTDRARHILGALASMDVRISIDDFGTGYSSLAYLSKLPVSELKIDKSFVQDMVTNPTNAMIVRATVDLGHNLGLEVVAEGVEDAGTLAHLKQLGCDLVQGFHPGVPQEDSDFRQWITKSLADGVLVRNGADLVVRTVNDGPPPPTAPFSAKDFG